MSVKICITFFIISFCLSSCDWGLEGKGSTYKTDNTRVLQKPCEDNEILNKKYNLLVDSLTRNFNYEKSFAEIKRSVEILKEIKKLQDASNCLIVQNGKFESIRKKCEEMKLSSELILKDIDDKDLKERVTFYTSMIRLLDE